MISFGFGYFIARSSASLEYRRAEFAMFLLLLVVGGDIQLLFLLVEKWPRGIRPVGLRS